jgi:3-oxoacyl-[acyl-carrier-protein] synthase II
MAYLAPDRRAPWVAVTGVSAMSAFGRGGQPLLDAALRGQPGFGQLSRFSVAGRRAQAAAAMPGPPVLADELVAAIGTACDAAGLDQQERSSAVFLLALHTDATVARDAAADVVIGDTPGEVAARSGMADPPRVYATACVSASTAIADAAATIVSGRASRVVVAAGYLVDADDFALFDGGRVLARDGRVRPFSAGRQGMLLGDGVAAAVLESAGVARRRDAPVSAWLAGWGRAGDAYHVVQPSPDGSGLARAIGAAMRRARMEPADIGYVNANGSGTSYADASEAAALHRWYALSRRAGAWPIRSATPPCSSRTGTLTRRSSSSRTPDGLTATPGPHCLSVRRRGHPRPR